ncbi:MAG: sugar ABC transporter substrate-binding protein [Devosia sp.]|jgi:inositol transport system substrate-binding protein|nr:sugar ABC transporter substrate-binding protein [Devosiaceae bacterium]
MKKLAMAALLGTLLMGTAMTGSASAANIGVSMAQFDDNFLTVLRNGMIDYAKTLPDVSLQVEDGGNDVNKQLSQVQNFVASKVDAIIVNPVDTSATEAITKLAADANIPLVYVNRQPVNLDKLPPNETFVGSNESDSGTLEAKQICKLLKDAGKGSGANVYVMEGQLNNQAAVQRTQDVKDVIATPDCNFIKIIDLQTANWSRDQAQSLMANWLTAGTPYDAVISNNDEMAIGALQAMKAAGVDTKSVIIGGVDATQDALASMKAGDLKVTVFQNAAGQGKGAVDAALKLAKGEKLDKAVWVPFELVTPDNMANYMTKN